MADCIYALTHHRWNAKESYFDLPAGCVAAVDLRTVPDCANAGVEAETVFVAMDPATTLDATFHVLGRGDLRDMRLSAAEQSLWESVTGYVPQGDALSDWLADHLLNGADPLGDDACKPLLPTTRGQLEIHLAGHSRVWSRAFQFGSDPHTNRVQAVLQADFRATFENVQAGRRTDPQLAEKVLDFWCDKYRIDKSDRKAWERLVPADLRRHIAGPVKHSTTRTDNFNRADGAIGSSSEGWSWSETVGAFLISSNEVAPSGVTDVVDARADADLSGSDHFAQVTVTAWGQNRHGVDARYSSSAYTCYLFMERHATPDCAIFKTVSGTDTALITGGSAPSLSYTLKGECNGSTLTLYINGGSNRTVTDTAITAGVRGGLHYSQPTASTAARFDDWSAEDLGGGGGSARTRSLMMTGVGA